MGDGLVVSLSSSGGGPDSATSDATTFPTDGTIRSCETCVCYTNMLATTSIVCGEEHDKSVGSEGGVDDHAAKFPLLWESAVCAKVASNCITFWLEVLDGITIPGESITDMVSYIAWAVGEDASSIFKEPDSSAPSVLNKGTVSSWEKTS